MLKTGIPVWKKHKLMMLSKNVFRQSVSWLKSSIQISCEIDFFTFVAEKWLRYLAIACVFIGVSQEEGDGSLAQLVARASATFF